MFAVFSRLSLAAEHKLTLFTNLLYLLKASGWEEISCDDVVLNVSSAILSVV